jgi:hypothetical protein
MMAYLQDFSLQMVLGPKLGPGSSGSKVADKELASEGVLSGIYQTYSNRRVQVDAQYYYLSMLFLLGILVLQCVLRKIRDRQAEGEDEERNTRIFEIKDGDKAKLEIKKGKNQCSPDSITMVKNGRKILASGFVHGLDSYSKQIQRESR